MLKINIGNGYSSIKRNERLQGEYIEQKIERIVNNSEPITDGAPIVFTEREEGVKPEFDVRTDKWDIAIEGMDNVSKAQIAKREERQRIRKEKENGKPEPLQGTELPAA